MHYVLRPVASANAICILVDLTIFASVLITCISHLKLFTKSDTATATATNGTRLSLLTIHSRAQFYENH